MKLINRDTYLKQLIDTLESPDIKVITGIRRSGKSKLLELFSRHIKKTFTNSNIISIDYNLDKFSNLLNYKSLLDYVKSKFKKQKINFLFVDEIQMCKDFEKAIISLYTEEKYKIYITGSNAFLSSNELATLFTGRTFSIEILPFSYNEFLKYYNYKNSFDLFERYIEEGGLSGSYLYKTNKQKYDYIKEIINVLLLKDIIKKYKIRNETLFNDIFLYLVNNISNITSANNIAEYCTSNNRKIDHKTVNNYISYLCNAYAFYKIKRYDIRGKKYLKSNEKYYLTDHAIRYALLGTKELDRGRLIENIVALELLRRFDEIYVGILYKTEIDFVVINRDEKIYIQVCDNISNNSTLERELSPLLKIKDGYKKVILTNTQQPKYSIEGVSIVDISRWLSKNESF